MKGFKCKPWSPLSMQESGNRKSKSREKFLRPKRGRASNQGDLVVIPLSQH